MKNLLGIVVIGRNEGTRLLACLNSALQEAIHIVYVDSGSSDDSVMLAKSLGVMVVELDLTAPFTAARARNEGFDALLESNDAIEYVHFIDGDCEFIAGWIEGAYSFMKSHPDYAVVCGQRKERYPEKSIFNALCDIEWNTPVGDAMACGGDALIRVSALQEVEGYPADFIAGEEPELCFRLRKHGYKIRRLEGLMTLHDAAITSFSQWWRRAERCGFAYTLGFDKHGHRPERYLRKEMYRVLLWGGLIPFIIIAASVTTSVGLLLLLVYPFQLIRLVRSSPLLEHRFSWAFYSIVGKAAEFMGVVNFYWKKTFNKKMKIIEYK